MYFTFWKHHSNKAEEFGLMYLWMQEGFIPLRVCLPNSTSESHSFNQTLSAPPDRILKLHKVTQSNLKTKLTDQGLWHRRMCRRSPCTPPQSWWGRRSCGWRCPPQNVSASFSARRTRLGFLGSTGTSCPRSHTWCPCAAEILAGTILFITNTFNFLGFAKTFIDHSVQWIHIGLV